MAQKKMHPVKSTLFRMKALLEKGWIKGDEYRSLKEVKRNAKEAEVPLKDLMSDPNDAAGYCMIGALRKVTPDPVHRSCVATILERYTNGARIEFFNDRHTTTFDNIEEVLVQAITNFREEV